VLDWIGSSGNLSHHQITGQHLKSQYPWARSQASNWKSIKSSASLGMISEDHWWTHQRGKGKPSELYSEVSRDGKLVYHPEFFWAKSSNWLTFWCWGTKITSLRKWFSSQDHDDEQFRLEPSDHEGKSSEREPSDHLPLAYHWSTFRIEGHFFTTFLSVDLQWDGS
jgi:hypothetical protein